MPAPTFDLQAHSLHSDGSLPAPEVVARAAGAGVELLALTDHDTVDGVEEALAAARRHNIRLSPAAEISSVDGHYEDLHVLGYELDHTDPQLLDILAGYREDRQRRIFAMADRLTELGWALDPGPLEARRAAGKPIGRPHLADSVVEHPDNAARLAEEGIADRSAFFAPYLVPGAAAYVARSRPGVEEAIEAIHAAGGVAVWAHPFWDVEDDGEVVAAIERFATAGLDGVECFYPSHDRAQTELLARTCERLDLLSTGSTDFHGPEHSRSADFRGFELHGLAPSLGPIGAR